MKKYLLIILLFAPVIVRPQFKALKFKEAKCNKKEYCYTFKGQDHCDSSYEGKAFTIVKIVKEIEHLIVFFKDEDGILCHSYVYESIEQNEIEYYGL